MKKPGFTLEQHKMLGQELKAMLERLSEIQSEISRAYPFKVSDKIAPATKAIADIKLLLDEIVCRENPGNEDALRVYLGSNKPKISG